ncbi:hypothetical protein B0A48_06156 [Cryoendolithus antarcticus]|uniref:Gnk2-homologous domain-containing protein n=1 Tax=Cryoendolithus antarcticus TaxID=1507870 RepID=A0A1V8TA67_9PEZI|nr:hypothetical protein B0A48_06156 [Cryoendolithus antarcticus]
MVRWQDRGEVPDSDDEDLSVGAESQVPEQAAQLVDTGAPTSWSYDGDHEGVPERSPTISTSERFATVDETAAVREHAAPPGLALPASQHSTHLDADSQPTVLERSAMQSKSRPTWYTGLFPAPRDDDVTPRPVSQHEIITGPMYAVDPGSAGSSPLSSPSTSPIAPEPNHEAFPVSSLRSSLDLQAFAIDAPRDDDAEDTNSRFGRRSLRTRQEKQLHPYMYEKELYQRQCRERGIKPVRLEEVAANAEETQDAMSSIAGSQEMLQTACSSSARDRSSSPMAIDNVISDRHALESTLQSSGSQSNASSDDDLLDIGDLIAYGTARPDDHRRKRRKRRKLSAHNAERTRAPLHNYGQESATDVTFAAPVSPPASSSSARPSSEKPVSTTMFRRPRGLSPAPLPTPEISSELRRPPRTSSTPGSVQRSAQRGTRRSKDSPVRVQTINDESSGKSGPDAYDPQLDDRRLVKERRRIKGVLPASWLKIDLKAQTVCRNAATLSDRDLSSSPTRGPPATQRGVARTIHRPYRRSPSLVLEASDRDEANSSPAPRAAALANTSPEHDNHHATSRAFSANANDDDVMEVDTIDMMFASASRGPRTLGLFRRKQPRITQAFQRVRSSTPQVKWPEERKAHRLRQVGPTVQRRQKTHHARPSAPGVKQAKLPTLGILDAPRGSAVMHEQLPNFVRLARRTAKRAQNAARASPTRKVIRLATRDDTAEASESLQAWRTGKLMPHDALTTSHTSICRLPLAHLPNYQQQSSLPEGRPLSSKDNSSQAWAQSPKTTLRQPRFDKYAAPRVAEQSEEAQARPSDTVQTPRVRHPKPPRPAVRYQTAQLESLETDEARLDRMTLFKRQIERMTEVASRIPQADEAAQCTTHFRRRSSSPTSASGAGGTPRTHKLITARPTAAGSSARRLPHRPRKRLAARLEIENAVYRQPVEPIARFDKHRPDDTAPLVSSKDSQTLQDLGSFGTRYTTDFDLRPLPPDVCWLRTTFIGSGDFAAAMAFGSRDLDVATGSLRIHINTEVHEWSAWTEEVSSAIGSIPVAIASVLSTLRGLTGNERAAMLDAATANVDHMLRSTVRYLTRCLWFLDPIDCTSCISRLHQLLDDLCDLSTDGLLLSPQLAALHRDILQYSLVIARQTTMIANSDFAPEEMRTRANKIFATIARALTAQLMHSRLDDLGQEYEMCLRLNDHELQDASLVLASVLILNHTLDGSFLSFWTVVNDRLATKVGLMSSIRELDSVWYSAFTLLPALALSATGRVMDVSFDNMPPMDWTLPRALISRCFELYAATSSQHGCTINEYLRVIMTRCYTLVASWHCWTCEPVLGAVFDFFAKRGLGLLRNEHGHGSPEFLEHLVGGKPDLLVTAQDHSFHIFLKLLAVTMCGMRQYGVYTDKKIASMTWRFIPNHARVYRRDAEVKQSDIEALRNHCDLLSTLYFAAPPSGRPSIRLLQDLVDLNTSHIEACRIIIKSWANLASFQTSLDEHKAMLAPLAAWFKDMVQITCNQYRLARTEAQQQYAEATVNGTLGLTHDLLERTVATNQRQVAAMLVDLLAGMRRAVSSAKYVSGVLFFIETAEPWKAFDSFDPSERRLLPVFNEALEMIKALIAIQPDAATHESQPVSDDSQDYGDSSIFQDLDGDPKRTEDNIRKDIVTRLAGHVAPLVSNAFGSEFAPDDALLMKLIDVWAILGTRLVQQGGHTWSNLVDDYSPAAWYQLRDTAQHRKYTPLFLARLVATGHAAFSSLKYALLAAWLKSLVERESNLKYQHELTGALLKHRDDDDLLSNLPFVSPADGSDTIVTLQELRERRLAMISSVLSSMRVNYNSAMCARPQPLSELRRTYADLLRQLLQAMKFNYQDLQIPGGNAVAGEAQGAYVVFVQQVVSALQQYTTDICPIDRFFTDSSVFPLPVNDPEYVVGRLRAYVPKLGDAKIRKQLAVFVHTVSERAAVDGQQAYLAEQLATAMSGPEDVEAHTGPSLRYVMVTSILPAYIENALASACSRFLAVPALDACTTVISELLYEIDLDSNESRERAVEETGAVLLSAQHMLRSVQLSLDTSRDKAETKVVLSRVLELCRAGTSLAQHIRRTTSTDDRLLRQLYQLRKAVHIIFERTHDPMEDIGMADELATVAESHVATRYPETGKFTAKQLRDSLAKDWYEVDGRYYVRRGIASKEVVMSLSTAEQVEARLRASMLRFEHSWQAITCTRKLGRRRMEEGDLGLGDLVV